MHLAINTVEGGIFRSRKCSMGDLKRSMSDTFEPPPLLYKYIPSGYSEKTSPEKALLPYLRNGYMRYTQPGALNDPFEMEGIYGATNFGKALSAFNEKKLKAMRKQAMLKGANRGQLGYPVAVLHEANKRVLADPKSADLGIAEEIRKRRDQTYGILSLSELWNNSAMWTHYSERHTGVCIGFDSSASIFKTQHNYGIKPVGKVRYLQERLPVDYATGEDIPPDLFFRKSLDWQYEYEWRSVARFPDLKRFSFRKEGEVNGFPLYLLYIDHEHVREIYLGALASKKTESLVLEFAAKKSVRVFRATLASTSYEMDRKELNS